LPEAIIDIILTQDGSRILRAINLDLIDGLAVPFGDDLWTCPGFVEC